MKTKNSFRTWKSGKTWLYSSLILGGLLLSSGLSINPAKVSAETKGTKSSQMTSATDITMGLQANLKATTTISAAQLANAQASGPFTAGVNQVIPFEAFGGDGMLTRLLLNSSNNAAWSDNGTAKNPALPPISGLESGKYFYEVDLAGTNGATGQNLLDLLRANGSKNYEATVKVYAADSSGKADTSKVVATKMIQVDLTGSTDNIKNTTTVSAAKLANAQAPGPFTAGVNQVIPFEAFGGDGMLTRLLLNSSNSAAWSDNGTAKNPALPPISGLESGKYFYEVDLAGTNGATGQNLLDLLRANGSKNYEATVKVYAADSSGKADTSKVVATKMIQVDLTGSTDNIKNTTTVSAAKLANAQAPGPFTAGVNQVIPFEAFGGDGMLTRLLLNSSNSAAWSDNGTAKNPALPPISGLESGKYFYEVDLAGTNGATGQNLLNLLRANGSKNYEATVKIYAADSSGKADTSKVVATKMIQVNLTKEQNTVASQEVYRLYNKMSGEHLYTTSAYEYNTLTMTNSSWSGEKVAWKAPKTGNNVYRVYNPNSGEHLYTESSFEVNSLVKQNGWKSEGVAFHSDSNSGTPVYRLYNPNSKLGAHFLTMSSYERDSLVKAGWKSEGIAFYAIK